MALLPVAMPGSLRLAGAMPSSPALTPGVDVLEIGVELNQNPVAFRRPVGDIDGLQPGCIASRFVRKGDRSVRRLSCGHLDVHT